MGSEGRLMTKTLPTLITFKGFFPCVSSLMINKSRLCKKRFLTFITLKGSISCVSSLMLSEG
ncbi:unnamed protein product [Gulo gulo]|uniref:Uncharacterized protein n=1 Tax=Gulo gulo TaxID=48420 RepID=A0A9X9Q7W6_GULGU|nr:unnamed protein product [Gulo gulo]